MYEYIRNRSIQDHLCNRFQKPLPWSTRLKIAQDAAQGLAYLHEGIEFQGINRNPMKNVIDPHNINANEIPNNKDANPAGVICDGVSSGDVLHLILRVSDLLVITGEEI
ncbi:hypothetical protein L2E82_33940 [Cichorium intybus]|uniref:Uncharacterized protein n=1 Tax=Cichorium intybus TaxID=13427 RepID=A0ACB9BLD1_CICIN|nr:hypothetical protein L2E82_33940 [Cichorium intybus]